MRAMRETEGEAMAIAFQGRFHNRCSTTSYALSELLYRCSPKCIHQVLTSCLRKVLGTPSSYAFSYSALGIPSSTKPFPSSHRTLLTLFLATIPAA